MNTSTRLIFASLLLAGCAQLPEKTAPEPAPAATMAAVPAAAVLPDVELSPELLYEYLLTEFASQRGHKALAVEGSAELARKTRDPRLAKRAAQLALESGDMNRAVEAFRFWQETEPDSDMAARMLSQLLLRGGRLEEARVEFEKVLKADVPNVGVTFLQIYPMVAAYPDKAAALHLVRELAAPYKNVSEVHWVVAQLARASGNDALALSEVRIAHALRPAWHLPVALEAQLLQKSAPQQGLALLAKYLSDHPEAGEIRLQYARSLLEQKQYPEARAEFQRLATDSPDNVELAFAVAMISLQLNDLPAAEAELRQALGRGGSGRDAVEYFLGQLNEAKEDEADALIHYREVKGGEYQFAANLRVVYLLSKQGKTDEARAYLQQAQPATLTQRAQMALIDAQLLRMAGRHAEAYRALQQGLVAMPNEPELLYEAGMLSDTLGRYDESEQLLRRLILIKPDYAQAYNALGYSMLVRNVHVATALELVEKALQLSPDDYAIMDSVGWGYFLNGRLDESIAMLRRAYAGNPDPEIAAHLGEVLWTKGEKDEAMRIWQDSLKAHPDSAQLKTVMKRLAP